MQTNTLEYYASEIIGEARTIYHLDGEIDHILHQLSSGIYKPYFASIEVLCNSVVKDRILWDIAGAENLNEILNSLRDTRDKLTWIREILREIHDITYDFIETQRKSLLSEKTFYEIPEVFETSVHMENGKITGYISGHGFLDDKEVVVDVAFHNIVSRKAPSVHVRIYEPLFITIEGIEIPFIRCYGFHFFDNITFRLRNILRRFRDYHDIDEDCMIVRSYLAFIKQLFNNIVEGKDTVFQIRREDLTTLADKMGERFIFGFDHERLSSLVKRLRDHELRDKIGKFLDNLYITKHILFIEKMGIYAGALDKGVIVVLYNLSLHVIKLGENPSHTIYKIDLRDGSIKKECELTLSHVQCPYEEWFRNMSVELYNIIEGICRERNNTKCLESLDKLKLAATMV